MNLKEKQDFVSKFPISLYFEINDVKQCPSCKTPSPKVSDKHQIWKCMACSAGGDAYKLYEELYNKSFPETIEMMFQDIQSKSTVRNLRYCELRTMSILDAMELVDKEEGLCLPHLDSNFVWSQKRICELFDSILKEYPLGIFLTWVTNQKIKAQKLNSAVLKDGKKVEFDIKPSEVKKHLVIDGQHRLQALYIGLRGSFHGKELYLNVLSSDDDYQIAFLDQNKASFPWIRFKDLVMDDSSMNTSTGNILGKAPIALSDTGIDRVAGHVALIVRIFHNREAIVFNEVYREGEVDKIEELIMRLNSGSKKFKSLKL